MPVQTSVKPKIKQAAESSQASSSPCADCGATNTKYLIDTCVVTTPDEDDDAPATVARKDLCGACVVGHDVPVKRSSGEWWFGEVKDYDNTRLHPFRMSFLDGDEEWTEVTRNPSVDYLKFVGIYNDQPEEEGDEEEEEAKKSLPKKLAEAGSIGSFTDSSCSSGASSFKPGKEEHAYPLFDDSKLIHLDERSLSSFDESVFSDDEGNVEVELVQSTMTSPSKPCITPMSKQTKSGNTKKGTKDKKTRRPVMWTPEEGRNLQRVVDSFNLEGKPLKWPDVAARMKNRNGKQCRERFINHLSSTLKSENWSPEEDATVFTSFFRIGKKWTKIAKMLRGRTDNGTKNRFHHLRRRLNKDVYRKVQKYSSMMSPSDADDESVSSLGGDSAGAIEQKTRKALKVLAAESKKKSSYSHIKGYVFGPYICITKEPKMCKRCGLFVPSEQTGNAMCTRTNWCEACCKTPTYVTHELLRECHELRRDGDFDEGAI